MQLAFKLTRRWTEASAEFGVGHVTATGEVELPLGGVDGEDETEAVALRTACEVRSRG